ncbi:MULTISPECIES: DUF883 family protein [Chromohalobacter]|uniref:YqjD family protein n=1 Tax=Chromohalobacter beijerinckii TaxID=86179 RepID=A0ABV8XI87_9GAMM|nr:MULTISPECIES: YqjD family protein [Chromohalobacter]NWO09408.1 DUF883 domain-containing protein [Chromohalobacter salexigens]MCK0753623.1 YqjD family protein [Chromohalobacter japonicus]MCK0764310.1 YqjD family protein [Chromohalobacter beijerinckii]MCT8467841.1 YqjD family protein [Chromohalobacter canadensis]MCT8470410.1 YqjD family protein [Chromohalobacter canadensis]
MTMQPTGGHRESEASTEQLKDDLRHLSQTVEELVKATADDSRGHITEARERAQQRLSETRAKLEARGEKFYESARDQMDCCDRYVRDNPWTSIGIGAGVGVVIGLLIGRR